MKKLFLMLAAVSLLSAANAQSVAELEAKKAVVDEQLANYDDGISKKWEYRVDFAAETAFGHDNIKYINKEEGLGLNIGYGYNFNSNLYAGLASGWYYKMGLSMTKTAPSYVPMLGDVTYRWNGKGEKWSFFLQGRGGYMLATNKNEMNRGVDYEFPNALYLDIQPGVYYRINRACDLKLSVGYAHLSPDDDTPDLLYSSNMLMAKVGVNFRQAPKTPARSLLLAEAASLAEQIEAARLAAEEAARQAALKAAQEEAARKAAAEAAAKKAAEEEAARLAALEADKHKNVTLFYEIRLSDITAEHSAKLDELCEWLKDRKIDKIVVKSYADKGTGNYQLNQMYARRRVETAKKTLIKRYGIDKKMIESSFYGDTVQPFEENDLNRCTIIVVNEVAE